MTNKPKIRSQDNRGPHPQRDNVPLAFVKQDNRNRENIPGSVALIICQDRCAILSRFCGWMGGGFPQLCSRNFNATVTWVLFFFPRALHVMLHLGQMFTSVCLLIPTKNTTIIYLSFQHMQQSGMAVEMQRVREPRLFCRAPSIPQSQATGRRHPHSSHLQDPLFSALNQ